MALSPTQLLAVQYLAGGESPAAVAARLRIKRGELKKWELTGEFARALAEAVIEHQALVSAALLEGEKRAAEVLVAALSAETKDGRPYWPIRMGAAVELLDRAGERGKAVEKQMVSAHVVQGNVGDAVAQALKDPGVRAWLDDHPEMKAKVLPRITATVADERQDAEAES